MLNFLLILLSFSIIATVLKSKLIFHVLQNKKEQKTLVLTMSTYPPPCIKVVQKIISKKTHYDNDSKNVNSGQELAAQKR